MTPLAVAVSGRGLVDPAAPVFAAGDEALLRGGVAFETIRVYDGRPFLFDRHLERFAHSAVVLALPGVETAVELAELVAGAAPPDHVLRLYRTDEVLVATAAAIPDGLEELRARGLALATVDVGTSTLLEGVKATSYAEAFAARRSVDADDALLVTGSRIRECATANIWWLVDGALRTPAAGPGVLAGVTRSLMLELEPAATEGDWPLTELFAADEAFTTSSIREVMPVRSVDGHTIGDGSPGVTAARLQAALRLRSTR